MPDRDLLDSGVLQPGPVPLPRRIPTRANGTDDPRDASLVSREHVTPGEPAIPGSRDHHVGGCCYHASVDHHVGNDRDRRSPRAGRGVSVLPRPGSGGSPSRRGVRRRHLRHGAALSILRFVFHLPDDRNPVPPSLASRRGEDGQEQRGGGQRMGSGRARLRSGHRGESPHHELRLGRGALRLCDRATVPTPTGPKLAGRRCLSRRRGHGGGVGPRCRHGDAELHQADHRLLCSAAMGYCPTATSRVSSGSLPVVDSVWEYASTLLLVVLALLRRLASVEVASRRRQRSFARRWASGR